MSKRTTNTNFKTDGQRDIKVTTIMANRRSTYFFPTREDYEKAREHFYNKMYQDQRDSDCLYFEGSYGDEYVISIMDRCSNPELAASICREHRGVYKYYPYS